MLARILDAHSAIAILPETRAFGVLGRYGCSEAFQDSWQYVLFMNEVWQSLRQYKDVAAQVLAEEAQARPRYVGSARVVLDSFGQAYAKARRAQVWGEKTPGHLVWLPEMYGLFPEAKIIVTVRDPRDVLVSYDDRWGGGRRDTCYLMESCAQVLHYLNHLLHRTAFPPDQIHRLKYEEVVTRPEAVLREVCDFLEVPFEPGMLEFYRANMTVEQDTPDGKFHKLLSRPLTSERVGRYRQAFTPVQIQLIEQFLGNGLTAIGYEPESDGTCILSQDEKLARDKGHRLYERMRSGAVRRRLRAKASFRLFVCRGLGTLAPSVLPRLAVTSRKWKARAAGRLSADGLSTQPSASLRHTP